MRLRIRPEGKELIVACGYEGDEAVEKKGEEAATVAGRKNTLTVYSAHKQTLPVLPKKQSEVLKQTNEKFWQAAPSWSG